MFGAIARGMMVDWEAILSLGGGLGFLIPSLRCFRDQVIIPRMDSYDIIRSMVTRSLTKFSPAHRAQKQTNKHSPRRDRPPGVLVCRENRETMPDPRATSQFCALYSFTGILLMVRRMPS